MYIGKQLFSHLTFLCFVLNFQVLKIDSKCVKALYRRAQAKRGLCEYDAALKDLRKAHFLSRNDKIIHREICSLKKLMLDYLTVEKIRCEKMFK
jgi:peptidyl-prolyl isomerase D